MGKQSAGLALRIRGAVEASTVAAAARPSGFELQMVTAYVASGASAERISLIYARPSTRCLAQIASRCARL